MNDVSHELGSLRYVVDSPLSSKVAMFNNHAQQHKQSQLLNPFSDSHSGRASPKPTFSKDDYGRPLAGSLTEMRGQKANMHVLKEMIELCQIIASEGYEVNDEPNMKVIPFGELFNIYNFISDKVVGILLRARKHKLVEFEGEMLYQRRDDDVPIFLLRPVAEIREELEGKIDEIKRASSPAPTATSILMDRQSGRLSVPGSRCSSRASSPSTSPTRMKKFTPINDVKVEATTMENDIKEPLIKPELKPKPEMELKPVPEKVQQEIKITSESHPVENEIPTTIVEPLKVNEQIEPKLNPEEQQDLVESKTDENNNDKVAIEPSNEENILGDDKPSLEPNSSDNKDETLSPLPTIVVEASAVQNQDGAPVKDNPELKIENITSEPSVSPPPSIDLI